MNNIHRQQRSSSSFECKALSKPV